MKTTLLYSGRKSQRGVVLVIALIALVALSLAGIAMMRSVDTSNVIAGNMSFKQASVVASDFGIGRAIALLNGPVWNNRTANFSTYYRATYDATDDFGVPVTIKNLPSCLNSNVESADLNAAVYQVLDGNNVRTGFCNIIFIERMCTANGTPYPNTCVMPTKSAEPPGGENKPGPKIPPAPTPYYRITVRTEGPLNTLTYVQGFFSAP